MQIEKILIAFLTAPTYEKARIEGLKELLRQMEFTHFQMTIAKGGPNFVGKFEFEQIINDVAKALSKVSS